MSRQLRIMWFYLQQFASVPYFSQLVITSTVASVFLQWLSWRTWGGDAQVLMLRAGIIGTWTTTTVAAGMIGLERFRGTLVHLIVAPVGTARVISALISAASLFGLLAFPISQATWLLLVHEIPTGVHLGWILFGILVMWLSCLIMSFVIAGLFLLTPNALAYEELLLVPVFFFSGLLFASSEIPPVVSAVNVIIPLHFPVELLLRDGGSWKELVIWLCVCMLWLLGARWLMQKAERRARIQGSLEVV